MKHPIVTDAQSPATSESINKRLKVALEKYVDRLGDLLIKDGKKNSMRRKRSPAKSKTQLARRLRPAHVRPRGGRDPHTNNSRQYGPILERRRRDGLRVHKNRSHW